MKEEGDMEVIIIIGVGCLMRVNCLKGMVACIGERPEALIIVVSDGKSNTYNNYQHGRITAGRWMGVTFQRDFGIKNPIIVEEKAKTIGGAIVFSKKILEKDGYLADISTFIIFCEDGKEKIVKEQAKKVFKGGEIQVFTFPRNKK